MDTKIQAVVGASNDKVKPFRIAFIGCGGIANHHANYLKKMPGVSIVAGCDIRQIALTTFKERHGVSRLFNSYEKMLKELKPGEVDAISVCTPNGVHAPATVAALKAGYHVLVEKPPAMNAREAETMVSAARKARKQLIIGFQHRFEPRSKVIKDYITAGDFGRILYVRAQALRRRGIPNFGVFGQKHLQGGGPLIDIGVHILETSHYLMGSPKPVTATGNTWTFMGNKPSSIVSTWANWDHKTYTVEDMAVGMIRFADGAMLTLESSFVAHLDKDIFNLQVFGEKGGAIWDISQIFLDHNHYMLSASPNFIGSWDMWEYKMSHFVEVCRDGRKNESPGEDGLVVQKMLDGIYASAEKKQEVRIK